jgi:drug/metabolite transporter (DMT)-like permease
MSTSIIETTENRLPATKGISRWLLLLHLGIVYVAWGSTYLGIRLASDTMPPFLMLGIRFELAGILLWGWTRFRGEPKLTRKEWLNAGMIGTLLLVGGTGGVALTEQFLPTGLTSLFVTSVPIYLTILDSFFIRRRRPSILVLIGLFIGIGGMLVLANPSAMPGISSKVWYKGVVIVLSAAAFWACGTIFSRLSKHPASAGAGIAAQMVVGGLGCFLVGAMTGEFGRFHPEQITVKSLFALIYLVSIGSLVAFSSYIWLTRHCSPTVIGTYSFVNPVVCLVLGVLFAGEQVTGTVLFGAFLILPAVLLILVGEGKARMENGEWRRQEPGKEAFPCFFLIELCHLFSPFF